MGAETAFKQGLIGMFEGSVVRRLYTALIVALLLIQLTQGSSFALADEPNVGVLRVADVKYPRQVAPSVQFWLTVDVEYAVRFNATIRSALFEGSPNNLGTELWDSDPTVVSGGGDAIWDLNLTTPSSEQEWSLTVIAYYEEAGGWKYYNDSEQGPGFAQITLKVARLATLEVDLGIPNIPVAVDNLTLKTSGSGSARFDLPVSQRYSVSVPAKLQLNNSTRVIFTGWHDGVNTTERTLLLDGDSSIAGSYRTQYLLRVASVLAAYEDSSWHDAGSNATLEVDHSVPMSGILGFLGLHYDFKSWSGDVNSTSSQLDIEMNGPKLVRSNFVLDYAAIVLPMIVVTGVAGGVILALLRRRMAEKEVLVEKEAKADQVVAEEPPLKFCDGCGEAIEEGWIHCARCGKGLASPESVRD